VSSQPSPVKTSLLPPRSQELSYRSFFSPLFCRSDHQFLEPTVPLPPQILDLDFPLNRRLSISSAAVNKKSLNLVFYHFPNTKHFQSLSRFSRSFFASCLWSVNICVLCSPCLTCIVHTPEFIKSRVVGKRCCYHPYMIRRGI